MSGISWPDVGVLAVMSCSVLGLMAMQKKTRLIGEIDRAVEAIQALELAWKARLDVGAKESKEVAKRLAKAEEGLLEAAPALTQGRHAGKGGHRVLDVAPGDVARRGWGARGQPAGRRDCRRARRGR